MSIYKRGKVYWYKFTFNGKLIRESTKQSNDKIARQIESAHRTSLAKKGEVGLREKCPSPKLCDFIEKRFEPWAKATFEKSSPKTWLDWYRVGLRAIKNYKRPAVLPCVTSSVPCRPLVQVIDSQRRRKASSGRSPCRRGPSLRTQAVQVQRPNSELLLLA